MYFFRLFIFLSCLLPGSFNPLFGSVFSLKNNLHLANPGDYIVLCIGPSVTLLHVKEIRNSVLDIEEIALSSNRMEVRNMDWKSYVAQGAPYHSSWVDYGINMHTGKLEYAYSATHRNWLQLSQAENFLSKLLNLQMHPISDRDRRKIGRAPMGGKTPVWQPPMVFEGQRVRGVRFDAWRGRWPNDGSDLSGKTIEVYVPGAEEPYPSYFPYWLQISGVVGKARVMIMDSGSGMKSPQPSLSQLLQKG